MNPSTADRTTLDGPVNEQLLARRRVSARPVVVHAAVAHIHAVHDGVPKRPAALDDSRAYARTYSGPMGSVLDLSKIEAGKLELNPQTVELALLIDEVVGTAKSACPSEQERLVVEAQDDVGTLTVDPMRLRQI